MSNQPISRLVTITAADLADGDYLPVADISVPETKKITVQELSNYVANSASLTIESASQSILYLRITIGFQFQCFIRILCVFWSS
jgi:hypothetical protein